MQPSMRKGKLRKVGLCFITVCFIKSFNIIINNFFDSQAHSQPNLSFLIFKKDDARNIKRGSRGRQIDRNGK